ncbi:hypothetical protein ACTHTY_11830, partial [Neisseria sp. P0019.S002]
FVLCLVVLVGVCSLSVFFGFVRVVGCIFYLFVRPCGVVVEVVFLVSLAALSVCVLLLCVVWLGVVLVCFCGWVVGWGGGLCGVVWGWFCLGGRCYWLAFVWWCFVVCGLPRLGLPCVFLPRVLLGGGICECGQLGRLSGFVRGWCVLLWCWW